MLLTAKFVISFCSVISQGKAVALDRWGGKRNHGCIYIFFWIPYWPRMLINILWHMLDANQYGGP